MRLGIPGCAGAGIQTVTQTGEDIPAGTALRTLSALVGELSDSGVGVEGLSLAIDELSAAVRWRGPRTAAQAAHYRSHPSKRAQGRGSCGSRNASQRRSIREFRTRISSGPAPCCPAIGRPNGDGVDVIRALFEAGAETVNIRTFRPQSLKGNPFVYGIATASEAITRVEQLASDGYYTIVNETIDVSDGGVSGVSLGGIVEFAPDATPRAVETREAASLTRPMFVELARLVYGANAPLPPSLRHRLEFSVHPRRVGLRREHVIVWEQEHVAEVSLTPSLTWPNAFSRRLGDKAFGLLVAHLCRPPGSSHHCDSRAGLRHSRFGEPTGTGETWIRTCPPEPVPGHFSTRLGWVDPVRLLQVEDPKSTEIVSVLAQESVDPAWSGAAIPRKGPRAYLVEGVAG